MDLGKAFSEMMVVAAAIVGLAVVAVLVSRQANTANVIRAGGQAFSGSLLAAISPVTGNPGMMAGGGFSTF